MEALSTLETIFAAVLSMSAMASLLIVAVIALRALLRHAPKWIACLLWGLVGIRLFCPVFMESPFSAFTPLSQVFPGLFVGDSSPGIDAGTDAFSAGAVADRALESTGTATYAGGSAATGASPSDTVPSLAPALPSGDDAAILIAASIWALGILAMAVYAIASYVRIRRSTHGCVPYASLHDASSLMRKTEAPVYCADAVRSPFILGVFRPKIYLPSHIDSETANAVIRHEEAHLARRDNLWKPLAYAILALHWFNPLCWVAFVLLGRDMESACDERVIAGLQLPQRKEYALALVNCSAPSHRVSACPIAFGEIGVKGRVKRVLDYKRPAFWIIVAGLLACAAVAFFFMTNPLSETRETPEDSTSSDPSITQNGEWESVTLDEIDPDLDKAISEAIIDHNDGKYQKGDFPFENHILLGPDDEKRIDGKLTALRVYVIARYGEFVTDRENGEVKDVGGSVVPAVLTFDVPPDGSYKLANYQEPGDGAEYEKDLEALFPPDVRKKIEEHWEEFCEDLDESINLAASNLTKTERAVAATSISASSENDEATSSNEVTYTDIKVYGSKASRRAYESVLNAYIKKLNTAAASLVDEFNAEAKKLKGDKTKLANLAKSKTDDLASIYTEGTRALKETALKYKNDVDTYDYWEGILCDVYVNAADKISDAHRKVLK